MCCFKSLYFFLFFFLQIKLSAQIKWQNVDADFQPLPKNFHVYKTDDSLYGKPFIAFYVEVKLKDKHLVFDTDTAFNRRLTPSQFYQKNNKPLLVVNGTFFSFETSQNLNAVIKNGELISYNIHTVKERGKDTFTYRHSFSSAIGITKKRKADVAWLFTDSNSKFTMASQVAVDPIKDFSKTFSFADANKTAKVLTAPKNTLLNSYLFTKWKMKTAIGGGPVLLQNGQINITNEKEIKFVGKAINDKHPRTCIGYTNNGKLIIMVIQGRFPNIAEGATLTEEAQLLKELGCKEALNLDGGGSSCLLINGKETIKPSDNTGQRAIPAVFIVRNKFF